MKIETFDIDICLSDRCDILLRIIKLDGSSSQSSTPTVFGNWKKEKQQNPTYTLEEKLPQTPFPSNTFF